MKLHHHIFPMLLAAMAFSSCSGDAPLSPAECEGKPTPIEIVATIDGSDASRSEASIKEFTVDEAFGLFVYKHGSDPYESFAPNTANIYVYCNKLVDGKARWRYYYNNRQYYSDMLYLICNEREGFKYNADFYAYYPYNSTASDLSSVKFDGYANITHAVQNETDYNKDYAMDGDTKTIKFHFVRKMARFMFHFRFYGGQHPDTPAWSSSQTLNSITVRQACLPEDVIISQNVFFNAFTGDLTLSDAPADIKKLNYPCNKTIDKYKYDGSWNKVEPEKYVDIPMRVPPCDLSSLADDDTVYTIDFVLGNVNVLTLDVTKAMLRHSDGTTYGMQAGYTYHFYITMQNYLHLEKVYVDKEWVNEPEEINIKI